ncbi:MAG: type II/IV secretion system protein [Oscillatoriales cyanobacterium SM2_2_1]|nr:type II/IV secretion system protein [Oscillatoriales cyanobacterium SM2_2_1]
MNTSDNSPISSRRTSRALAKRGGRTPFETKLIEGGHATSEQFDRAIKDSQEQNAPFLAVLESLIGQELAPDIARFYKKQQLFELRLVYGIEPLDPELDVDKFDIEALSKLIDSNLIPIQICRECEMLPIAKTDTSAVVAMVVPDSFKAQDELSRQLKGLTVIRRVISREDFQDTIDRIVQFQLNKSSKGENEISDSELQITDDALGDKLEEGQSDGTEDLVLGGENSKPVIDLVDKILIKALKDGASDIHVEPQEKELRIRFRKDGVLKEQFFLSDDKRLPKSITNAVISRFKIISNLNIAERRVPQDGKLKRNFQGRRVDFRVNTCPTQNGEKVCLRILDNSNTQLGLDKLITNPDSLKLMQDFARRPYGLILVTGPTGSGKTTTLYSTLAECNDPGINISTAEDPVEYNLAGLTQCQVIREKGMNFATILRAFLRQDPDVILVGETRDQETAKTAIEAALTGHLVLTTLHTNDAPSAIARLEEMGVEPFMASTAIIGILAQRLVRRVCDVCRIPYAPTKEELDRFGLPMSDLNTTFYRANTVNRENLAPGQKLCPKCSGSGYKGRAGVYEIMKMTERLQGAINKGATTEVIKEIAVQEGMVTLMSYAFQLVREGRTTLDEVLRVVYTDKGREAEERARRGIGLECQNCDAVLTPETLECPYCTTPRTF